MASYEQMGYLPAIERVITAGSQLAGRSATVIGSHNLRPDTVSFAPTYVLAWRDLGVRALWADYVDVYVEAMTGLSQQLKVLNREGVLKDDSTYTRARYDFAVDSATARYLEFDVHRDGSITGAEALDLGGSLNRDLVRLRLLYLNTHRAVRQSSRRAKGLHTIVLGAGVFLYVMAKLRGFVATGPLAPESTEGPDEAMVA